MDYDGTTIAISKDTRKRVIIEVIHPHEAETGENCSFNKALVLLLDQYHPSRKKKK